VGDPAVEGCSTGNEAEGDWFARGVGVIVDDQGRLIGTLFATTDVSQLKAIKVRVEVAPPSSGLHCAGRLWPEGATEDVLETDDGATGFARLDDATGQLSRAMTLEGKLAALYTLEGRRRLGDSPDNCHWHKWSESMFEQPNGMRAPRMLRVTPLDHQRHDGKWASELRAEVLGGALAELNEQIGAAWKAAADVAQHEEPAPPESASASEEVSE
jgi:hypothetical protein